MMLRSLRRLAAALPLAALLGFTLGVGACSESDGHTYVDVDVNIDTTTLDANRQYLIVSCELHVTGADEQTEVLPCRENHVPIHVGTLQWSSAAKSGSLTFTVTVFDANRVVLGSGSSPPVPVSPGKHLTSSVLIMGVAPPDGDDGGVSPQDAGADGPATSDAAAD